MKRSLLVLLTLALILSLFSCNKEEYSFYARGKYIVELEGSGIVFSAVLDDNYEEYLFTAPDTVAGLKAVSYDGVNYKISYEGLETDLSKEAIQTATDFGAAARLLENAKSTTDSRFYISVDGLSAEGLLTKGKLTHLSFSGNGVGRNYKIQTEATG